MHNTNQSQTNSKTNVPGCSNPDLPETLTAEAAKAMMQIKPKHTQGPWYAVGNKVFKDIGDRQYLVAECADWSGDIDETEMNARLIAAMPDLLRMLNTLVPYVLHYATMQHSCSDAHKDVANAMAIIRNATF